MEELDRTTNEEIIIEEQNDTSTDLNETINEYASNEWGVDSISQVLEDQISEMDDVKRRRREVIQRNSLQFGESSIDGVEQDDDDEWNEEDEEDEDDDEDYDVYQPTSNPSFPLTFPFPPSLASATWRHSTLHDPSPYHTSTLSHLSSLLRLSGLTSNQLKFTFKRLRSSTLSEIRFRTMSDLLGPQPSLGGTGRRQELYGTMETLAYAKKRYGRNTQVVRRVLEEVQILRPDFSPTSVLDFGSGLGPASSAAYRVWGCIESFLGVDRAKSAREGYGWMMERIDEEFGEQRMRGGEGGRKRAMFSVSPHYSKSRTSTQHSLVVSSYVLSTLPRSDQYRMVSDLWSLVEPGGLMVIVDKGTPEGFAGIIKVREQAFGREVWSDRRKRGMGRGGVMVEEGWGEDSDLIELPDGRWVKPYELEEVEGEGGGVEDEEERVEYVSEESFKGLKDCRVVAPCTHHGKCPVVEKFKKRGAVGVGYCSFVQKVKVEGKRDGEEKFSYLVMEKVQEEGEEEEVEELNDSEESGSVVSSDDGDAAAVGRVVLAPLKRRGHVVVDVCVPVGIEEGTGEEKAVIKRMVLGRKTYGKEVYRVARKSRWGGLFPDLEIEEEEEEGGMGGV
ncbi:hypothetical protein TrCOL_g8978 [Triparma columacea]|uniref:Methyltransferase domain-containing protein n=1 Tax=Triparma columacea TaxID=722753 RepID=A0A9W7GQH5_9STRA|nr:hypothetical protein TrCOL_g8978 [Triparma columacea]